MIMPNKVVKPIDSLISIGGFILKNLKNKNMNIDILFENINREYPKKISMEKIILSLDFLYSIDKIELENDKVKLK